MARGSSTSPRMHTMLDQAFKDLSSDLQSYLERHLLDHHQPNLRVNRKEWKKNWLEWNDEFANGGTLDFDLAEEPSGWSS
ncbi:MAG: hypothetical protein Q9202_003820 [Teloschistes flavicans]